MSNYYADKLNSQFLFRVYDTAIPRIKQYLDCEIDFVQKNISKTDSVLEIGAGYGRIIKELSPYCASILGMDISSQNVALGKDYLSGCPNALLLESDVHNMTFDVMFDVILCLQNGLSAIRADFTVIENIVKLLAPNGTLYISSYSASFWDWRLKWFEEQSQKRLIGEIDYEHTKDGVIVCKDGFKSTSHSPEALTEIADKIGLPYQIMEIDKSSIFLIIKNKF